MKRTKQHLNPCCDRRHFLRGSGLTLAGLGLASVLPSPWVRHALAAGPFDNKRLLFLFLRGGNDGINTIIPHGDPDYNTTNRPTLYIPPGDAIDLGNGFASFHPALADLMEVHDAGDLASIHRVGYPNMSRSHFDGQRIWENGDPQVPALFEGWLYRYLVEEGVASMGELPALSVANFQPTIVRGSEQFINIADAENFGRPLTGAERIKYDNLLRGNYEPLGGTPEYRPILAQSGVQIIDSIDEINAWDQANWNPTHPDTGDYLFPVDDTTDPNDRFNNFRGFFQSLKLLTLSLLESDPSSPNGTRVGGTELGGFDTHGDQGQLAGAQPALLEAVAYGIRSLRIALSGTATNDPRNYPSIWNDTMVVTLSEFGRTSIENGSEGTDHGSAAAVFLAGGGVNGGLYNLSSWEAGAMNSGADGRDLAYATDYRAVMWELLRDHMGANASNVERFFPGYTAAGLSELGLVP